MILQHFIFPKEDICTESELYIKKEQGNFCIEEQGISMEGEGNYSFFTYFNSFSVGKWMHYTKVSDITFCAEIKGAGMIRMYQAVVHGQQIVRKEIRQQEYHSSDCQKIQISVPKEVQEGILYVEIETARQTYMQNARFETSQSQNREISIAVGICTFKREEYVRKTLQNLQSSFFDQPESALHGHLHVYVSDNGNTLPYEAINGEYVRCYPNKNAGGASGFTRALLEALKDQEKQQYTHFLFMDDDISIEPEVLYRTYRLLSMLSESYYHAAIGGVLMRKDLPQIQNAREEIWVKDKVKSFKVGYDLSKEKDLLANEEIISADYNGWWYYCMPFSEEIADNLPLPFFIHMDDIEYGLRFSGEIIHCNGIGVWHDAFEHRKSSSMEYYDIRNLLIMNALRRPEYTWKQARKRVWRHLIFQRLKYRYRDAELTIQGVEDYCKGISFLKTQDPVKLHQDIMKKGYAWTEQTEQLDRIKPDWHDQEEVNRIMQCSKEQPWWKQITLNGWLLPAERKIQAIPMGVSMGALYRVKTVLYYDPETGKGFLTKRKHRELFCLLQDMLYVNRLLRKNYDKAAKEYREREKEITSRQFWEKYLF